MKEYNNKVSCIEIRSHSCRRLAFGLVNNHHSSLFTFSYLSLPSCSRQKRFRKHNRSFGTNFQKVPHSHPDVDLEKFSTWPSQPGRPVMHLLHELLTPADWQGSIPECRKPSSRLPQASFWGNFCTWLLPLMEDMMWTTFLHSALHWPCSQKVFGSARKCDLLLRDSLVQSESLTVNLY